MDIIIRLGQFILMISLLVTLHELGHYIPAKLFKTKVEKFYLFFDPWFSIFKKKIGETTYGIGWLPMGGYVKIAGMVDESMDTDQMKSPPKPWEFRSKPAWQRLIILLGGVTVNVLLAWVILTGMFMINGQRYESVSKIQENGLMFNDLGKEIGFRNGDKILSVDGKPQEQFNRLMLDILLSDEILVDRDGETVKLHIQDEQIKKLLSSGGRETFMFPRISGIVVDSVSTASALQAGLKNGDRILSINGKSLVFFDELAEVLPNYKGDSVLLDVVRNGKITQLKAPVSDSGTIGFRPAIHLKENFTVHNKHSFFSAVPLAIKESFIGLGYNIKQFKILIKPKTEAYKQASGPLGIARKLPKEWDWNFFWSFSAMFSMWLAFLNLLPIPGLDGGHALITLGEMVTRRKLNEKAMGILQTIGMIILLSLMALIFGKDIYDWVQDKFVF